MRQLTLFDSARLTLEHAIELSLESLNIYGQLYDHWAIAYSGGKDSSATVTFVAWAIKTGRVPRPKSLTVLYVDTRLELAPLQQTAMQLLDSLRHDDFNAHVIMPPIDSRFMVYMLGYGVPPASNTFRWCTSAIKVEPMAETLRQLRDEHGKFLMLTGVRLGESAARDQRIALSCSRDSGECGQGWFQMSTPENVADTLAPLLHWRLCHVYDWLYFDTFKHEYDVHGIATVYGDSEVRTGCISCPLASRDVALERLIKHQEWAHLSPLLELKPLWRELKRPKWRKRKAIPERRQDGQWSTNVQRMGPLTMSARRYGLERVLDIQSRARVDLINADEEARIREMWALNMWPRKWSSDDINADVQIPTMSIADNGQIVEQALLLKQE